MMLKCYIQGQKRDHLYISAKSNKQKSFKLAFFLKYCSVLPEHFKYLVFKPRLVCVGVFTVLGEGFTDAAV